MEKLVNTNNKKPFEAFVEINESFDKLKSKTQYESCIKLFGWVFHWIKKKEIDENVKDLNEYQWGNE